MTGKSPTDLELLRLATSEASAWEYAAELELELLQLRAALQQAEERQQALNGIEAQLQQILVALVRSKEPHTEPHHPGSCRTCAANRQLEGMLVRARGSVAKAA